MTAMGSMFHKNSRISRVNFRCATEKFAENDSIFCAILDSVPHKIWTARPDGTHDYFNQRWRFFTGVDLHDSQCAHWIDLIHPDDRGPLQAQWQHSLASGDDFEIEYRLRHKSGDYFWMLARAHPIRSENGMIERWLGTSTDIHKAKIVEQALAVREGHYRGLIEASALVVWFAAPDGTVTHSKGWTELTGQSHEQYVGRGWLMAVHPEDHSRIIGVWKAALAAEASYEAEFRIKCCNGEYRWVVSSAVPVHENDRQLLEWVGSITDIHERKQAEAKLQASEERLRLAIETTGLGIWDVDLKTGRREWSREAKEIIGLPEGDPVTPGSFLNQVHPDDRVDIETPFFSTLQDASRVYDGTFRVVCPGTGEVRWVAATGRTIINADGLPGRKIGTVQDITAKEHAKIVLRASEQRLRLALEASRMVAWEQDLSTNFVTRSDNAIGLLGIGSGPILDMLVNIHPEDRCLLEQFRPGRGVKGSNNIEFRYTPPNGELMWLGLRGEWAGADRLIGVTFDITDRKEAEIDIWRAANHDPLTGLANRALLQHRLENALKSAKQDGTSVVLLLIDFDHFKEINDALGHDAGDALLKEAATRLKAMTRECDTVARFSGDEFAVIVVEPQCLADASHLAESMIAKLSEPIVYRGHSIGCAASIGVAAYPDHDADPANLLKDADIALYEAKAQGRSRGVKFSHALRHAVEERSALLQNVREALSNGDIVPFYQPKVCLKTMEINGLEILARWCHPIKGILSAEYFGAAFDDGRLAIDISSSILTKSLSDLRCWLDAGIFSGRVAFNISACEFNQPDLTERVLGVLHSANIPPENFEIEITETVLLSRNPESITKVLNQFHHLGVSIALDDFGTGFGSLTHLKRFPVDHIKIDRSFVQRLEHDERDKAIVSTIIELGRKLGMSVTAEGVETENQKLLLQEWGADFGQGYLFAKPAEASRISSMLTFGSLLVNGGPGCGS